VDLTTATKINVLASDVYNKHIVFIKATEFIQVPGLSGTIKKAEPSLELYRYCVASEFDGFEGLWQKTCVCWYIKAAVTEMEAIVRPRTAWTCLDSLTSEIRMGYSTKTPIA
jgi:hypothetical protein